jgi:hypothetical protein
MSSAAESSAQAPAPAALPAPAHAPSLNPSLFDFRPRSAAEDLDAYRGLLFDERVLVLVAAGNFHPTRKFMCCIQLMTFGMRRPILCQGLPTWDWPSP